MKAKSPTSPALNPDGSPGESPGEFPFISTEDMEAWEEWARIKSEFGEDEGKVVLKRRNAKGQLAMLDFMSVADFSIDRVMQDWGGGRYVAAAFKQQTKMGQIQFEVDESIPKRTPIKENPAAQQVQVVTQGPTIEDPRIAALERSIQSTNDLMKVMITALVSKQGNGDGALETGMKIAEMINARTPAPESMKPAFADLKEIFLAGIEAKEAAEGGGDEGYLPVIKAFAGPITDLVTHVTKGGGRPALMAGSVPVVHPAPPAVPPGPSWLVHLRPHLPTLLGWAEAGKDPELYAEVILDNIAPGAQMEIAQAAKDPEFVSQTLQALPMFTPYSAWAAAVLANIKKLLIEEPEDTGTGDDAT